MATVYLHKRKDNKEVFYVGIGKETKRAFSSKHRSSFWHNYTSKHEYFIEILTEGVTWEEACKMEKELICFYGRIDLGFGELKNLTNGGDGAVGRVTSDETKKRISNSVKGRKASAYQKFRASVCNKGNKNWLGKKHSEDTKLKIGEGNSKKVNQFSLDGCFIKEHKSATEASKVTIAQQSKIIAVCRNKRKTAGGFIWKYKN